MTDRPQLSALPDPGDQQLFDWLLEPEAVDPRRMLQRVALEIADMRQVRRTPWDSAVEALRPAPFGRPAARGIALLVAATLLLATAVSMLLVAGGQAPVIQPTPSPTVAPSSGAPAVIVSPFADTPFELVTADDQVVLNVIDTADGVPHRIGADLSGTLVQPAWNPDGASVLILEVTQESDQIWRVPASGVGRSLVMIPCVSPCGSRNEQSYSHDGSKVVLFQAVADGMCGLALYDTTTQIIDEMTLSACGLVEERHPRFSPDDRSIAFWRTHQDVQFGAIVESAIFTRDLASGEERQLTEWDANASVLDWSPDGEWITFVPDSWKDMNVVADLWRVRADGTGLEQLTSIDSPANSLVRPRYSPDGRWILFQRMDASTSRLWAIPAEGGDPIEVLPGWPGPVMDYDVRASDATR